MSPAIVMPTPECTDVRSALDDLGCSLERLEALFESNNIDLQQAIDGAPGGWPTDRFQRVWMIFKLAVEKLGEVRLVVDAITTRAYLDGLPPAPVTPAEQVGA
jgi:hypothetical protein